MISYYNVMKYLCCSTVAACMYSYHTAAETRRPTDRRVRQQTQLLIGSHSNTARTNYCTRVVLLPALLAGGRRV